MSFRSIRLRSRPSAFTLVEMLIAMVLTLIMVAAIAEFYARVGDSVKDGRAMIEMGSQMRNAVTRLKGDLELLTLSVGTVNDDGAGSGYFEINEGAGSDNDVNGNGLLDPNVLDLPHISLPGLDNQKDPTTGVYDWLEPKVTRR